MLPKRRGATRTFKIRCPFCRKTHIHGAGLDDGSPVESYLGHRVAHCLSGENPGYILTLSPQACGDREALP
ncbi:MAG: hypothetical protein HY720_12640 [Planctomycetes bacterium]|nr:hypothetical protein [Planctomycetota bacterium]